MFLNNIAYKRDRTLLVIIFRNGGISSGDSTGTGFSISEDEIMTCFHVAFGWGLNFIKTDPIYLGLPAQQDEHLKLQNYFNQKINKLEVELPGGLREEVTLARFDETRDVAILKLRRENAKLKHFRLDTDSRAKLGQGVFFCGFGASVGYRIDQVPFAVYTGIVSTFLDADLGQGKYEHMRINGISVDGISGSPVFRKRSNVVIGIINGSEIRNLSENFMVASGTTGGVPKSISFKVPIGIALSTPLRNIAKDFFSPR